jgi:hypothetical protein
MEDGDGGGRRGRSGGKYNKLRLSSASYWLLLIKQRKRMMVRDFFLLFSHYFFPIVPGFHYPTKWKQAFFTSFLSQGTAPIHLSTYL